MSGSKYYVSGMDLSNILQPYSSGTKSTTNFLINGVDIGTIYQPYSSGTKTSATNFLVGGNDLCNLCQRLYVPFGLINYYNFQTSYSGSGTSVTNLVNSTADMTLFGSASFNNTTKTMTFNNSGTTGNIGMQGTGTISNFKTVSIWYKQLAQSHTGYSCYLFDGRPTSGTNNGTYLWQGGVGSFWTKMYIDGGSSVTPAYTSSDFTVGTWHNLTYTSPSDLTVAGLLTVSNRFSKLEGAATEIAAVMVYDREITQAENAQNYDYMKVLYGKTGVAFP